MSTRFLSSLYFKGSLGFLIHRFQASKRLLAVHTQTLFIFWAKGIPFIHDRSIRPIRKSNHISRSSHCKLKHKNNLNPTCCVLFYGCIINSIMLDLTKTRQEVMLLLAMQVSSSLVHFLPVTKVSWLHQVAAKACRLLLWLLHGGITCSRHANTHKKKNGLQFKTNS